MLSRLALAIIIVLPGANASADAINMSRAAGANTIAEIFIEADTIDVRLEIGLQDLATFHNLLPDELREMLNLEPAPVAERMKKFVTQDMFFSVDGERPLIGRVVEAGPGSKVKRDVLTGTIIPPAEGEEPALVVNARLLYPLPPGTEKLYMRPPMSPPASIGFVVYHRTIPVIDFRYWGMTELLHLDLDDPFYSRFDKRNLRRQYDAPMNAFLYVEPFEVRKEIVLRPIDLQHWLDLGLEGRDTIPVDVQDELKAKIVEFLMDKNPVTIDGRSIAPRLDRINFITRTLTGTGVIDPPREMDALSATLGIIFSYPVPTIPKHVSMEWELWNERIQRIPTAATDPAGPLPYFLSPDDNVLHWENFLKFDPMPTLRAITSPPSFWTRWLGRAPWIGVVAGALLLTMALWRRRAGASMTPLVAAATVLLTGGALGFVTIPARDADQAQTEVLSALLHNLYRAFDYREESDIYDVLDQSVTGDLLRSTYLETKRGLVLASQGGALVKVDTVDLVNATFEPRDDGFTALATWTVTGSVGHWGHVHKRSNRYQAELDVAPVDGVWKIVGLELLQEERI